MSDGDQHAFYLNKLRGAMGRYDESCDQLHPELAQESSHHAFTETLYFGFNVPKANIDGLCYVIHRPNLGVVEGGVQVFQGVKRSMLASEIFDFRNYMSDKDFVKGNLQSFKLESGLCFERTSGRHEFHLRYDDPARKNTIDLVVTPASEPVVWPNGRHFEQTMKNDGEVVLRGRRYRIDGYHVRDRSWEAARLERPESIPGQAWFFGAKDSSVSFQCTSCDHPDLKPQWQGCFDVGVERSLLGGWIWMDGEMAFVETARNRVLRNRDTLFPEVIDIDIVDTKGRRIEAHGTITAAAPFFPYLNLRGVFCLVRWETSAGDIMWGEIQDAQFTDFVHMMMK